MACHQEDMVLLVGGASKRNLEETLSAKWRECESRASKNGSTQGRNQTQFQQEANPWRNQGVVAKEAKFWSFAISQSKREEAFASSCLYDSVCGYAYGSTELNKVHWSKAQQTAQTKAAMLYKIHCVKG